MNLKDYFDIWNDGWKLFRQYAEQLPQSDDDWHNVVTAVGEFSEKHGSTYPAMKMAALIYRLLENEWEIHHSEKADAER